MAEKRRLAIALLAAGQSRRFGTEDKLAADLDGQKLGLHAANAVSQLNAEHSWVIAARADHPCAAEWIEQGFQIVVNEDAHEGLGTSVALATGLALQAQADALLIVLADMPFVTPKHLAAMAGKAEPRALLASHNGRAPTPPALFGSTHFSTLMQASGDRGAGDLLKQAETLACPPDQLRDIDTPSDLEVGN